MKLLIIVIWVFWFAGSDFENCSTISVLLPTLLVFFFRFLWVELLVLRYLCITSRAFFPNFYRFSYFLTYCWNISLNF